VLRADLAQVGRSGGEEHCLHNLMKGRTFFVLTYFPEKERSGVAPYAPYSAIKEPDYSSGEIEILYHGIDQVRARGKKEGHLDDAFVPVLKEEQFRARHPSLQRRKGKK